MQAIITKYLPPTNTRGARIKATCDAGSVTVPYEHGGNGWRFAHNVAATTLAHKLGWHGAYVVGGLPEGMGGQCYVNVSRTHDGRTNATAETLEVRADGLHVLTEPHGAPYTFRVEG